MAGILSNTLKLLKGASIFGKKIPLGIGAVITAGFVLAEVGSNIAAGDGRKALAATFAGVAEVGGSVFGFGDMTREVARGAMIGIGGEAYTANKSDLRQIAELGVEIATGVTAETQVAQNDPLLTNPLDETVDIDLATLFATEAAGERVPDAFDLAVIQAMRLAPKEQALALA